MERPTMQITGPVLDSADPTGPARFYERLLGWTIEAIEGPRTGYPSDDAWARLRAPDGSMKIEIQWEEHYQRPVWPTEPGRPQMMVHLDIGSDDLEAAVTWAVGCGAEIAASQPQDDVRVMLDPDGHPFCLFEVRR